jgi:hypothetical protein
MIGIMVWNLKAKIIEIETALLHGDLEESIFMDIPSAIEVGNGKFLVLKKTIYGLKQSARQLYVKLVKELKSYGFTGSLVYPCLWLNQYNIGIFMMAIYVDDCLTNEYDEGIKEVIECLKKHDFGIKIEEDLKD